MRSNTCSATTERRRLVCFDAVALPIVGVGIYTKFAAGGGVRFEVSCASSGAVVAAECSRDWRNAFRGRCTVSGVSVRSAAGRFYTKTNGQSHIITVKAKRHT